MSAVPVITIDGPNASGKGTISQMVANRLHFGLLDSGALYRLVALSALNNGTALDEVDRLVALALNLRAEFVPGEVGEPVEVRLDDTNVTIELRTEECGAAASKVATYPALREALLDRQRAFRQLPGLVADGRDMGTVVFPDASVKIFLTASPEVRAQRRYKQLMAKGISVNLADLSAEIAERDRRDRERDAAPLVPAKDAISLDTSTLTIDAVLGRVLASAKAAGIG